MLLMGVGLVGVEVIHARVLTNVEDTNAIKDIVNARQVQTIMLKNMLL